MDKKSHIRVLLVLFSLLQAYLSYLSQFGKISFVPLDWLISIFSLPVYFLLLPIVGMIENLVPIDLNLTEYRNWLLPHLRLNAWLIGVIFFFPLNILYLKIIRKIYKVLRK
ncbi:hypothetical protein C1N32_21475 [Vibrio diazotrophicus]|uniref:Uncharacterized protein n=1 Tax=Vibrio diazotrophicus TaxID=685 RepID=A0A2J8HQ35_VIBDI|nr:hypothetical protein C1N32_21475 [Vibrio diazotrophicus]